MIQSNLIRSSILLATILLGFASARTLKHANYNDDSVSPVIPSPNQDFGETQVSDEVGDIQRMGASANSAVDMEQQAASNEAVVPVYVSPFVRSERSTSASLSPLNFDHQESSHAPPNYAPKPSASATQPLASSSPKDLKTSASYGHHHHGGHYGHDTSGWLDMGAWTGGKGSFGWYADYPVGGKHHYGYGKR